MKHETWKQAMAALEGLEQAHPLRPVPLTEVRFKIHLHPSFSTQRSYCAYSANGLLYLRRATWNHFEHERHLGADPQIVATESICSDPAALEHMAARMTSLRPALSEVPGHWLTVDGTTCEFTPFERGTALYSAKWQHLDHGLPDAFHNAFDRLLRFVDDEFSVPVIDPNNRFGL